MPAKNNTNLGLAGNQNVAIFDDFCRRRLCSYRVVRAKANSA